MPYLGHAVSVRFHFRLTGAAAELAETGLHVGTEAGLTLVEAQAVQSNLLTGWEDVYGAFVNLMQTPQMSWAAYSQLYGMRFAVEGPDGLEKTDPIERVALSPTNGGTANVWPQLSVVLSLRSGSRLGQANYGRMFLPHTALPIGSGQPAGANPAAIVTTAKAFLDQVNESAGGAVDGYVINRSSVGTGSSKHVAAVWVGSVTDTQRSRRNQLQETYGQAALA